MTKLFMTTAFALLSLCINAQDKTELGPTMGWSSWNTFGINISESLIKQQADAMVSKGYKAAGYTFINIDDGYFGGRDADGHLLIHPQRFPNGMKGVVDYIHKKGLKAGIYSDAGKNTCASMFGGDKIGEGVGLLNHEDDDANFWFNTLGFDFIKVDFCGGSPGHNKEGLKLNEEQRYRKIWNAIQKTGRTDVRMNICRWAFPGTWASEVSTSWRTTGDINCSWNSVKSILKENFYLSAFCGPLSFNDMDMLEVGRGLSTEEDKTHFGMWCIMDSPLLIGCDMRTTSETAQKLMCNKELIALNQDTLFQQAYVVKRDGELYTLVKDIEVLNGKVRAVALLNLSDASKLMTLNFADVDLGGKVQMRDLFYRRNLAEQDTTAFEVRVPAHGCKIYRLEAEERYERTIYEAETAYLSAYQEIENNQTAQSATFSEDANCSGGVKVGWLGQRSSNDLQWRNVYSKDGGSYKMMLDYICGESRRINIEVNGKRVKTVSLNSGGWSTIKTSTFDIELQPGQNVIRLYTNDKIWMPDIDCMRLEYQVPAAIEGVKSTKRQRKVYNLQGIEVPNTESLPRGIYIINGQKRKII
ncbi:MAG: alpha-galactosidase [Bacteroidaceae bacterium]|nr:alpha-galactosidase [Bacteroidaceae bacterium]